MNNHFFIHSYICKCADGYVLDPTRKRCIKTTNGTGKGVVQVNIWAKNSPEENWGNLGIRGKKKVRLKQKVIAEGDEISDFGQFIYQWVWNLL